jgi:hypothetical protein
MHRRGGGYRVRRSTYGYAGEETIRKQQRDRRELCRWGRPRYCRRGGDRGEVKSRPWRARRVGGTALGSDQD